MATEQVTNHRDGSTTTVIEKSGSGVGGIVIGVALLALVAIVAFFLISQNRNDALRTNAVTSAASSVAGAADNVGKAAGDAADAVNPAK